MDSVLWSSETKVELFRPTDQPYIWRKKNGAYAEKNTLPTIKPAGGLAMLWGCFASSGTGNLQHVEGKMDSLKYQEIIGENVCEENEMRVIGPSKRKMILRIPQIPPRLGCRSSPGRFHSGHHS